MNSTASKKCVSITPLAPRKGQFPTWKLTVNSTGKSYKFTRSMFRIIQVIYDDELPPANCIMIANVYVIVVDNDVETIHDAFTKYG